jgi:hypothetical protein
MRWIYAFLPFNQRSFFSISVFGICCVLYELKIFFSFSSSRSVENFIQFQHLKQHKFSCVCCFSDAKGGQLTDLSLRSDSFPLGGETKWQQLRIVLEGILKTGNCLLVLAKNSNRQFNLNEFKLIHNFPQQKPPQKIPSQLISNCLRSPYLTRSSRSLFLVGWLCTLLISQFIKF